MSLKNTKNHYLIGKFNKILINYLFIYFNGDDGNDDVNEQQFLRKA